MSFFYFAKISFFSGIKLKRNFLEKNENLSHFPQTKCENEAEWLPKNILFVKRFFLFAGNPSYTKLIITKVEQTKATTTGLAIIGFIWF